MTAVLFCYHRDSTVLSPSLDPRKLEPGKRSTMLGIKERRMSTVHKLMLYMAFLGLTTITIVYKRVLFYLRQKSTSSPPPVLGKLFPNLVLDRCLPLWPLWEATRTRRLAVTPQDGLIMASLIPYMYVTSLNITARWSEVSAGGNAVFPTKPQILLPRSLASPSAVSVQPGGVIPIPKQSRMASP